MKDTEPRPPSNSMNHCNGHQICAIDVETTGLDPMKHEIIEIAIIPLTANLDLRKDVVPFSVMMKPDNPESIDPESLKVNGIEMLDLMAKGLTQEKGRWLLEQWIEKLKLPFTESGKRKKIMPLGHNYGFDRGFIINWLGPTMYDELFDYHNRDTMVAAAFLNDKAAFRGQVVPYSKVNLTWLASKHGVEYHRKHRAFDDAWTTAQLYKKMMFDGGLL